jgi:hypothetical protein
MAYQRARGGPTGQGALLARALVSYVVVGPGPAGQDPLHPPWWTWSFLRRRSGGPDGHAVPGRRPAAPNPAHAAAGCGDEEATALSPPALYLTLVGRCYSSDMLLPPRERKGCRCLALSGG